MDGLIYDASYVIFSPTLKIFLNDLRGTYVVFLRVIESKFHLGHILVTLPVALNIEVDL